MFVVLIRPPFVFKEFGRLFNFVEAKYKCFLSVISFPLRLTEFEERHSIVGISDQFV